MIIACLDDEDEGLRKKGPDRDWLRRRAERGSYAHAGIVTELAGLFLMSEQQWKLINIAFNVAELGNICFGRKSCVQETKMFLTSGENSFCFRAAKFVSATYMYVSRAAKLGNSCLHNNVSATMFPSLTRPLEYNLPFVWQLSHCVLSPRLSLALPS